LAIPGERVLVSSVLDSSYRFATASSESLEERLAETLKDPSVKLDPVRHLNALLPECKLQPEIPATGYEVERHVPRRLRVEIVSPEQLCNLRRWEDNLGGGLFEDGYALVCVVEDSQGLREALSLAQSVKHPQIAVAVPRKPVQDLLRFARRHEALRHIERSNPSIYGPYGELREEWEMEESEYKELIGTELRGLLWGEEGPVEKLCWFWRGEEQQEVRRTSQVINLATTVMNEVFPYTPPVPHDVLANERKKDTFRKFRVPVIDRILQPDGPKTLVGETAAAQKHVIDALLRTNGVLRTESGGYIIGRPDPNRHQAMAAVWDEIDSFVKRARSGERIEMSELVQRLRRPPYGLPVRSMPVIFAAVVRDPAMRGNLEFIQTKRTYSTVHALFTSLNGETIEDAFQSPESYVLVHIDLSQQQRAFLSGLASAFGVELPRTDSVAELIDAVQKGVMQWWNNLPRHAQLTRSISEDAQEVRDQILSSLAMPAANAREILLDTLPNLIQPGEDANRIAAEDVKEFFVSIREEIEGAVNGLRDRLRDVILQVMSKERKGMECLDAAIADWFASLPEEKRDYQFPGDAGELVSICRNPEDNFVDRLASTLIGMDISAWADEVVEQFRGHLESAKDAVEAYEIPGNGETTIPPKDHVIVTIVDHDGNKRRRTVPVVDEFSNNGRLMESIVRSAVEGMGRTLPDGECLSILLMVLRDALEVY